MSSRLGALLIDPLFSWSIIRERNGGSDNPVFQPTQVREDKESK